MEGIEQQSAIEDRLPDLISEFVIEKVEDYEELNATTLEEGKSKFKTALAKALEKQEVEEKPLGIGSQSLVQRLKEGKGLVLKRLMFGKNLKGQANLTPEQYFQHKKDEYELVKKYFGSEFVPHTEFVEVGTNFNSPHPDTIPGHEFVMVQEEVNGEDISYQGATEYDFSDTEISDKLKTNLREFIRRYRYMAQESKTVLEDQLKIDFNTGRVMIYDTDFLRSFDNFKNGNKFLEYANIEPISIQNSGNIINLLSERLPDFAGMKNLSEDEILEQLPLIESVIFTKAVSNLIKDLRSKGLDLPEIQPIINGLSQLVVAIDYFPLRGDNFFIKRLSENFHLNTNP